MSETTRACPFAKTCEWEPKCAGISPVHGYVTRYCLAGGAGLAYYLYVPDDLAEGAPLIIVVHGISRNAKELAIEFSALANRYGAVILAPLFDAHTYPAYQRLGIGRSGRQSHPDRDLQAVIQDVGDRTGARTDRVHLFGYSGGGQFAHRFAMAYPEHVKSVAMAAPVWFTFPDEERDFPLGLKFPADEQSPTLSAENFLKVPMAVFVGENDNRGDEALNRAADTDRQPVFNRIVRAQYWVDAMRYSAVNYGYKTPYRFHRLTESGHSFAGCIHKGNLDHHVFEFFLGQRQPETFYGRRSSDQPTPHLVFQAL